MAKKNSIIKWLITYLIFLFLWGIGVIFITKGLGIDFQAGCGIFICGIAFYVKDMEI